MSLMTIQCPECREDRLFEQPHPAGAGCGRDGECAELACVECGTALFSGALPIMVGTAGVPRARPQRPERAA